MGTMTGSNNLQSLKYSSGDKPTLAVLDQLLIPHEKKYIDIPDVEAAWGVIRSMQIRGAPLIAIVALLGLAVDLNSNAKTIGELDAIKDDGDALMKFIETKLDYLSTSRPTAVNLFNAIAELKGVLQNAKAKFNGEGTIRGCLCKAVVQHTEFMLERDVQDNRHIGKFGAEEILKGKEGKVTIMTICNTGSLATAGYGTALGVARALQEMDKLESIIALETRPYNQGSRLTAFEIVEEKMPGGTLICDSAAGAMMRTKKIDAVVVGADRCCANGDTANKIGTYNVSVVAAGHGVPVYVASPFTTLDVSLTNGDGITIEERPSNELISSAKAPPSINCWNPAFDVTPAKFIAGIITEKGVILPEADGSFDVPAFV
ncbi:Methylthioribose-1-phosphate isomerase [Seminavis robusta]|uniref:Methylthioribose-1-phosphate isomerase n=1 Tax=Seminavis robusta TaxID=568900 RepID=A0A9N8EAZ4_9STRA|nr:Methylthioribose-1-phosphate isomerase [Seminavis robusta]|eukprot:Sro692_g188180.1 Methylthioribose-1-phosphate isomerase (374) ;mRNA; r:47060-48339